MDSVSDFLSMGGYAQFVWPAFGVTAVVMIALLVQSRRALRDNESTLESLQDERREGRERAAPGALAERQDDA
jgi:heme exporter protein D